MPFSYCHIFSVFPLYLHLSSFTRTPILSSSPHPIFEPPTPPPPYKVVGESSLAVLDARSGSLLAAAAVPQPPKRKPIIGDFDDDGAAEVSLKAVN